jgi:hypothetical protein
MLNGLPGILLTTLLTLKQWFFQFLIKNSYWGTYVAHHKRKTTLNPRPTVIIRIPRGDQKSAS